MIQIKLDNWKMIIIMSQVMMGVIFKTKCLKASWELNQGWLTLCELFFIEKWIKIKDGRNRKHENLLNKKTTSWFET